MQFTPARADELREETRADETLHELKKVILNGWPARRCETHPAVREFWSIRDSLVIDDSLIIKGTAVVIPRKLQQWYLDRLHDGHQGRVKMELRARDAVYWPSMKQEIEARVASCLPCRSTRPVTRASTIDAEHQHPVPAGPSALICFISTGRTTSSSRTTTQSFHLCMSWQVHPALKSSR